MSEHTCRECKWSLTGVGVVLCPLHDAARDLLAALEGLDPTHQGDQQGAAYWLPIHLHPLHRRKDDCPWCQRDTTIAKAKLPA